MDFGDGGFGSGGTRGFHRAAAGAEKRGAERCDDRDRDEQLDERYSVASGEWRVASF